MQTEKKGLSDTRTTSLSADLPNTILIWWAQETLWWNITQVSLPIYVMPDENIQTYKGKNIKKETT